MMNLANLALLADHLEALDPNEYNQAQWDMCLCGHTRNLMHPDSPALEQWHELSHLPTYIGQAANWLGIDTSTALALFIDLDPTITSEQAVSVVRTLMITGNVVPPSATPEPHYPLYSPACRRSLIARLLESV